jgi:hypothetical protein
MSANRKEEMKKEAQPFKIDERLRNRFEYIFQSTWKFFLRGI